MKGGRKVSDLHRQLTERIGKLRGALRGMDDAERTLHGRAREQLDTMPRALDVAAQHREAGRAGVLGHRYHQRLLREGADLAAIVHERGAPDGGEE